MSEAARLTQQEDEDIQRKRLLMQYSKFKSLASNLQKFSNELDHGSMEVAEKVLAQLIRELLTMELWGKRLHAIQLANNKDQSNYQSRKAEQEAAIIKAREDIQERKATLEEAKTERQHNEEYERLRHQVMQFASRSATHTECQDLEDDILGLESSSATLDLVAERQRKQFGLMMHCIEEQQGVGVEEEESTAPALPDKENGVTEETQLVPESMDME